MARLAVIGPWLLEVSGEPGADDLWTAQVGEDYACRWSDDSRTPVDNVDPDPNVICAMVECDSATADAIEADDAYTVMWRNPESRKPSENPSAAEHVRNRNRLADVHGVPPGQLNKILGPPGQSKRRDEAWDELRAWAEALPKKQSTPPGRGGRR